MNLMPTRGRVIVQRPPKEEAKTASGILLPGQEEKPTEQAIVVAVGQSVLADIKQGDIVLFGMYSGQSITHEGTDFLVLCEGDILAVVTE